MLASWVTEEVKDVDLQDKRLNDRFAVVLDQLAGHPTASIPAACGGYTSHGKHCYILKRLKVGCE